MLCNEDEVADKTISTVEDAAETLSKNILDDNRIPILDTSSEISDPHIQSDETSETKNNVINDHMSENDNLSNINDDMNIEHMEQDNGTPSVNVDTPCVESDIECAFQNDDCHSILEDVDAPVNNSFPSVRCESSASNCTPLSQDEQLIVAEIEKATSNKEEKTLSDKIFEISKSVSPPTWISWGTSVLDSRNSNGIQSKSMFTSLNNLMDKSLERHHVTIASSASMNDIDKIDEKHQSILFKDMQQLRKGDYSDLQSDISNSISELDAYEKVKQEALALDNTDCSDISEDVGNPLKIIREQQHRIKKLEYELDVANGTIKHVYDESTNRIQEVSVKYEAKIAHIDKRFIECIKEKDILKSSLDESMDARKKLQSNKENLIKSLSNQSDENERLRAKLHMSTDDCVKLKKELDIRCYELTEMKKQLKKNGDDLSSASIKVQWANTKLKSETDAHQLTRAKLSTMDAKIRESKEEANMIRANCQAMIDKYQHSEEIQSNALGTKLEKLEMEHKDLKLQFNTMKQKYEDKCIETENVNESLELVKEQLFEKEEEYRKVLRESKDQENKKMKLANELEDLDERLNSYNELRAELKNAYHNNQLLDKSICEMREKVQTLESCNEDLIKKEKKNLDYFQKISSKNADLQLEVNSLKIEGEGIKKQLDSVTVGRDELSSKFSEISDKYSKNIGESQSSISQLEENIRELETCKEKLENQVHDLKNDATVSKRKHQADNKDLIRQIEQFRKQFERQEESMRRSESFTSIESSDKKNRSGTSSDADDTASVSNDSGATMSLENARVLLIERLCAVQRQLAKRQEKVEFFESHVNTLTKEVQKKAQVIQNLLLRVETGERTSLVGEAYKRSTYDAWGQPSNGMTLKLSMEINEKLQQVLEDTLFKNITLKENIKTLGDEVDRIKSS